MHKSFILVALLAVSVNADEASKGSNGINAVGMTLPNGDPLTGAGIRIGQVEPGRPPKAGVDSPAEINPNFTPAEVWVQTAMATLDDQIDEHATWVADIMLHSGQGVSPGASLYSGAYITESSAGYIDALRTLQRIATRPDATGTRAINNSWAKTLVPLSSTDGNTLMTLGADWMASTHEVLMVFAGAEFEKDETVPSDNYNGITVSSSVVSQGAYREASADNTYNEDVDAVGDRVSVDLLAPGELSATGLGGDVFTVTGTSFAVPHVTGTVALLQEYGDHQITNVGSPYWDSDNPKRHEVMKAVLLNSADKLQGIHGSQRDVTSDDETGNYLWDESQAFHDPAISLDIQMGAGHLNARRALTQFKSGEWDAGQIVPEIGWDYHETGGTGTTISYFLPEDISGYVAITLAWDRQVTKIGGSDTVYDPSNMFTAALNDLDLYLVPVGWDNLLEDAVGLSIAGDDTVEHIFFEFTPEPFTQYEIVVDHFGGAGTDQDFAIAWWLGTNAGVSTPGDFNNDGRVDGDDLTQWKGDFGGPGSDADGDGDSDGADFLAWQRNLGFGLPATPASVPEPSAWMLLALGLPLLIRPSK